MKKWKMPIQRKILLLCFSVCVPFIIMLVYLLQSMNNYSSEYQSIVDNMTVANDYNLNFKEDMDESLYKLVVGSISFEDIKEDSNLKDPYQMIESLRSAFRQVRDVTKDTDSGFWLENLLRNLDTLENQVRVIQTNLGEQNSYNTNIAELDNNIYILTELIQDDIQFYIYYQIRNMDVLTTSLHRQVKEFLFFCALITAGMALLAAVISLLISKGLIRPVQELKKTTEKIAKGDFSVRARVHSKDEIEDLAGEFNLMTENMEALVDKIKEDEAKLRRMDLRLLQEQINPHFLYNTLDTIVWLIEGNDPEKAEEVVISLSNYFRTTLSKGKEFISFREEENHIRNYLQIQIVRYYDILEYEIHFEEVLYGYQILKLTLQPLVENALYHGIKCKRDMGCITIEGRMKPEGICLRVSDNGIGMKEEELKELQEQIQKPCQETTKGFGLANVNERIKKNYGNKYGISITSKEGEGTTVEVLVPAVKLPD